MRYLYLASSFRGKGVAELILSDIERLLEKDARKIKVLYITTAGNLHEPEKRIWINEGREILKNRGWNVFDYDIAGKTETEVRQAVTESDVIFVQGGNTVYLLQQMQKCKFKKILEEALGDFKPYIGESAGSIVCADDIEEQQYMSADAPGNTPKLKNYKGLGFVNFLIKPHWNREDKRDKYSKFLKENPDEFFSIKKPIICLNDNQLIYVEGDGFEIREGK